MSKTRKAGNLRRAGNHPLCAWTLVGLGALSFLAGCGSTAPHTHAGDPLFGEYYPKGPNGQPLPPPPNNAPTKTSSLGVPPYPTANSASSTASLAANANLNGGRSLAINENSGPNWTMTSTAGRPLAGTSLPPGSSPVVEPVPRDMTVSGPVAANNISPAPAKIPPIAIGNSQPIIAAGSWSNGSQAPSSTGPPAPMGTVTAGGLEMTLKGRGAIGLTQKPAAEGVQVSCYVPQRSDPANLRYLETTARDYPSALQAILQQIDQ